MVDKILLFIGFFVLYSSSLSFLFYILIRIFVKVMKPIYEEEAIQKREEMENILNEIKRIYLSKR
nr:MAG TPA: hypothetical protein [Inoviridae sp.]